MSRLSKKQPSVCTSDPLSDGEVCRKLAVLRQILTSCFGPCGRLKQIHNNVGGHVLTTSTSAVLLKSLTMSHPVQKLLAASVLNHVSRFSDCGLFAGILCSSLVDHARGLSVQPGMVAAVYRRLLGLCGSYLSRDNCGCKVPVDLGSSHSLLALVRGVVTSKPACMLTHGEARHIGVRVVQAFLHTIPHHSPGPVCLGKTVTVAVEGRPVGDSTVLPGLLVDLPETLRPADLEQLAQGAFRLALFSVSLAGDLSEPGEGTYEVDWEVCLEATVLGQLLRLAEQVVRDGVRVFVCQRVVHPVLQQYLRKHGVIVVERLGIALLEPLIRATGAQAVATFQTPVPAQSYGQVAGLCVQHCGSREMLHLLPAGDSACCTLVLCHRNETMLNELKVACQRAEHILRLTLKEPWALLGGGCTETHLCAYIRHQCHSDVCRAMPELGCTRADYLQVADGFCRSLDAVGRALEHDDGERLVDLTHGHHWAVPVGAPPQASWGDVVGSCGCGLMPPRRDLEWSPLSTEYPPFSPAPPVDTEAHPLVLDSFPAKSNALQVAVETANLLLDLKYIIEDVS
ncbi:hypothetical protein AAFF_G00117120 [Aldrovandia affinis]|uniref:Uncharacterized protein n=1 Tax=Aldrovandia affinis TaxID=143900 RepID=A0AAD7T3H9_9TELE|nr:hypothetical protein AAFF_G00117120 [Aldrovandia affinis]